MSAPSWLYAKSSKVAETAVKEQVTREVESQVASTPPPQMNASFTAEEKTQLGKVHWVLRIIYMIDAILLSACAAIAIQASNATANVTAGTNGNTDAWGTTFLSLYVFCFAVLICCFEVGLTVISKCMSQNFGFMYTVRSLLTLSTAVPSNPTSRQ